MPEAEERFGIEAQLLVDDFVRNAQVYDSTMQNMQSSTQRYSRQVEESASATADSWAKEFDHLFNRIDRLKEGYADLEKREEQFAAETVKATEQAASGWEMFSKSVIGQALKLRGLIFTGKALTEAFVQPFRQFIEFGREGVELQRTRNNLMRLTGSAEEYNKVMEEMREKTRGTITDAKLASQAYRVLSLGFAESAEEAATVSRNVTLLAQAMGQIPTDDAALQAFSTMISSRSKERLDDFGLSVQELDRRMEDLVETGIDVNEAFRTSVFEMMEERVQELGLDVVDANTKLSQLGTTFSNIWDNLKMALGPEFEDFVDTVNWIFSPINDNIEKIEGAWVRWVARVRGSFDAYIAPALKGTAALLYGIRSAIKGNAEAEERAIALLNQASEDWMNREQVYWDSVENTIRTHYERRVDYAKDSADGQLDATRDMIREAEAEYEELADAIEAAYADAEASARSRMESLARSEFYKALDMRREMAEEREADLREAAERMVEIERDMADSIRKANDAYRDAVINAEKSHRDRLIDIERNYQKRVRSINRDYQDTLWEAVGERNATEALLAKRRRKRRLQEAKEERNEQVSEANEQYQERLEAAREALETQKREARENYEERRRDLQEHLEEQERQRQQDYRNRLDDLQRYNRRRMGEIYQAWGNEIATAYLKYNQELTAARTHYNNMLNDLSWYLQRRRELLSGYNYTAGSGGGGSRGFGNEPKQAGGYIYATGDYAMHKDEFVLNPSTTKQMENLLGGMLTQQRVLSAATSQLLVQTPSRVDHVVSGDINTAVDAVVRSKVGELDGVIEAAVTDVLRQVFR